MADKKHDGAEGKPQQAKSCFVCRSTIGKKFKECKGCHAYFHNGCAESAGPLPDGTFKKCCGEKATKAATDEQQIVPHEDIINAVADEIASLQKIITDIKESLKSLEEKIKQCVAVVEENIRQVQSEIQNFRIDVQAFKNTFQSAGGAAAEAGAGAAAGSYAGGSAGAAVHTMPEEILSIMSKELSERTSRMKNLIIYGVEESTGLSEQIRNFEDMDKFLTILATLNLPRVPFNTLRLGNSIALSTPRPLRILFNSAHIVDKIIKVIIAAQKNHTYPAALNGVSIWRDRTDWERMEIRKTKEELNRRLNNGEQNLFIVFRKGVPYIVKRVDYPIQDSEDDHSQDRLI